MGSDQLLTHSRMGSFKGCRKRAYWEYEIGIRRTTDAKALRMGSAYHEGLDQLKLGNGIEAAAQVVRDYYANHVPPAETDEQAVDYDMETQTVVAMVSGYHWRWENHPLEVVESEKPFRLPLKNPETGAASRNWELAGKIDGIVRLEDGRLAVLEHKLQSDEIEPESDYWRRLQLDHQITLYVYAAREMGYPVDTVLYDVARKPTIRPEKVPLLDEEGKKVVEDAYGNRVRNASVKAKKSCEICKGTGEVNGQPCPCTLGAWRQTGDSEKGYVLQTRPMTCDEWVEKLLADIGERPGFYYARQEIPRLDQDIEEFRAEIWDLQKVMRDAQVSNRWFRTVSKDSCGWCAYFGLCTSKFNPQTGLVPEGFQYVVNKHPELGEEIDASAT